MGNVSCNVNSLEPEHYLSVLVETRVTFLTLSSPTAKKLQQRNTALFKRTGTVANTSKQKYIRLIYCQSFHSCASVYKIYLVLYNMMR